MKGPAKALEAGEASGPDCPSKAEQRRAQLGPFLFLEELPGVQGGDPSHLPLSLAWKPEQQVGTNNGNSLCPHRKPSETLRLLCGSLRVSIGTGSEVQVAHGQPHPGCPVWSG